MTDYSMLPNPYTRYANEVLSAPRRAAQQHSPQQHSPQQHSTPPRRSHVVASEKDAPMVLRGAAKQIAEDSAQFRRYQQHRKRERDALMAGKFGHEVQRLARLLKDLTPQMASMLFESLESNKWFASADDAFRFVILEMIDDGICRMRVREGLAPIDDALPGEEPTVFQICRTNLRVR